MTIFYVCMLLIVYLLLICLYHFYTYRICVIKLHSRQRLLLTWPGRVNTNGRGGTIRKTLYQWIPYIPLSDEKFIYMQLVAWWQTSFNIETMQDFSALILSSQRRHESLSLNEQRHESLRNVIFFQSLSLISDND